jgi:hypothetical protein
MARRRSGTATSRTPDRSSFGQLSWIRSYWFKDADRIFTRTLEPEELDLSRQQLESGFDEIGAVAPELRGIVAHN